MHRTAECPTVPPAPEPDNLATACQIEADLALAEWQHNRTQPPEQRLHDYDECARDRAYEGVLEIVRRMVA